MSRIVLVTGCSTGGIGFALCEEFARQGCKVYATSRKVETIGEFQDKTIEKLALDVTNDLDVQNAVQHIAEVEGRIDLVVNNAGLISAGPLIDQSLEYVQRIFDTNVYAVLRMARAVIPLMAKRKSGVIVNIGSIVGEFATPWNGVYCSSKAALQSISDVLSMECKPFNISVLHICPGAVKSNISANGAKDFSLPPDSLYSAYLSNILKRIYASQSPTTMPAEVFAKQVVSKALRPRPPLYVLLGGQAMLFKVLRWLPKRWVLFLMWREYSKGVPML